MTPLRRVVVFLRNFSRRECVEAELHDELHAAFESLGDDYVRAGLSPDEARRAAAVAFGPIGSVKDRVRDVRAGALSTGPSSKSRAAQLRQPNRPRLHLTLTVDRLLP